LQTFGRECQFVDATILEISSRMAVGPEMSGPVGVSPTTRRSVGKQAPRTIRGRNSSALRLRQQPRRHSRVAEEDLYHCNRRSVLHYELGWSRETSLAGVVRSRRFLHVTQFLGWTPIDFWIMLM